LQDIHAKLGELYQKYVPKDTRDTKFDLQMPIVNDDLEEYGNRIFS
jgi:hypothetical protein